MKSKLMTYDLPELKHTMERLGLDSSNLSKEQIIEILLNVKFDETKKQEEIDMKKTFGRVRCLSGGADGADSLFGSIFSNTIVYSFRGHKAYMHKGNIKHICDVNQPRITDIYRKISVMRGREMSKNDYIANLIKRDFWQCNDLDGTLTQAVIAIATLENKSQVEGGTGYAVEWAKINKVALIFVLDYKNMQWHKFNYTSNAFDKVTAPDLTEITLFTGIGSRSVKGAYEDICRKEIEKVFTKNVKIDETKEEKKMTKEQMVELCRTRGYKKYSGLNKPELEKFIKEREEEEIKIKEHNIKAVTAVNAVVAVSNKEAKKTINFGEFYNLVKDEQANNLDKFIKASNKIVVLPVKGISAENDHFVCIHEGTSPNNEVIMADGSTYTPFDSFYFNLKLMCKGVNKGMVESIKNIKKHKIDVQSILESLPEEIKQYPIFLANMGKRSNLHRDGEYFNYSVKGKEFIGVVKSCWFDTVHPAHTTFDKRTILTTMSNNLMAQIYGMSSAEMALKFIKADALAQVMSNFEVEADYFMDENVNDDYLKIIAENIFSTEGIELPGKFTASHICSDKYGVYLLFDKQTVGIKTEILKYFCQEFINNKLTESKGIENAKKRFNARLKAFLSKKIGEVKDIFKEFQTELPAFYGTIYGSTDLYHGAISVPSKYKYVFKKRGCEIQKDSEGRRYVDISMLSKREPVLSQFANITRVYFHNHETDAIYTYAPQFCGGGIGADYDGDSAFFFFMDDINKVVGKKMNTKSDCFVKNLKHSKESENGYLELELMSYDEVIERWFEVKELSESFTTEVFPAIMGFSGNNPKVANIQTWVLQKDSAGICGGFLNKALIDMKDHKIFDLANALQEYGIKCKRGVTEEHETFIELMHLLVTDKDWSEDFLNNVTPEMIKVIFG